MKFNNLIAIATILLGFIRPVQADEPLTIYTVNYPLQYFAQRIAGTHARVIFPVPADQDPAFWMPDAEMIGHFQRADLILLNGANYAKWINKVSLPVLKTVNTSSAFNNEYLQTKTGVTHSHGYDGEHSHQGIAFTTWLDFNQAVQQAESIKQALINRRPLLKDQFDTNFSLLKQDLLSLDNQLRQLTADRPDLLLMASHPVYQYLARRYQMNMQAMLWEPDDYPTEPDWKKLLTRLINRPAQWMIWEGKPLPETIARLKSMGLKNVVFEPCANRPDKGDFMIKMRQNLENMTAIYRDTDKIGQ